LAPADIRKDGVALDLPTSLALVFALNQMKTTKLEKYAFIGELALDGSLRPVNGVLPVAVACWKDKLDGLILPYENAKEAAIIDELNVYPASSLNEVVNFLEDKLTIEPFKVNKSEMFSHLDESPVDMYDVKGQFHVKRALEVAAAGGHNVLMLGPPGSGKNYVSQTYSYDSAGINSGRIFGNHQNSFCSRSDWKQKGSCHQSSVSLSTSYNQRCGFDWRGKLSKNPEKFSLSHNGVLFLDELAGI